MRMLTRVKKVSYDMQSELKMADRGRKWTDEEIRALLAIWSDAKIQRQLLGATRNTTMFRNNLKRCLADTKISFEFV